MHALINHLKSYAYVFHVGIYDRLQIFFILRVSESHHDIILKKRNIAGDSNYKKDELFDEGQNSFSSELVSSNSFPLSLK